MQALWIAYAIATRQWWFLLSAFAYGGANIYGITKRTACQDAPVIAETDHAALEKRLWVAEQRLTLARRSLVATGYFTADQVSDDVAPRVTELMSHYTPDDEPSCP